MRHCTTNPARGFTLMEMIVVMGLFSVIVVSATDIFVMANKAQRKVYGLERIQADARYAMEAVVREIRADRIDLEYYAARTAPLANPDTELALIDVSGQAIRFSQSDASQTASCPDAQSAPCLLVSVGGGAPVSMTPKGVKVRSARFYVAPVVDPFSYDVGTSSYASDVQPHVTFVLTLETAGDRIGERSVVTLQTTAVQRRYAR